MDSISKTLIILGFILIAFGLVWHLSGGNIPLGRLPGDIRYKSENGSFYFPITTCLIISGILSLISYFLKK
tara:strand:- start:3192 stop:3404 length:213 start_codon:yes stop_codon:yes gene_type:complete